MLLDAERLEQVHEGNQERLQRQDHPDEEERPEGPPEREAS